MPSSASISAKPRAVAFAAGGGLALGVFGHAHVGFELRLLVGERLRARGAPLSRRASRSADAAAQPLDVRVRAFASVPSSEAIWASISSRASRARSLS